MRIYAISDLHLDITGSKPMNIFNEVWDDYTNKIIESYKQLEIKKEDVLLICGDLSWAMKLDNAKLDFEYLKNFDCKKIIIKGNHDYWWQSITAVREALPENTFALQNNAIKFGQYIFCGTRGWMIDEGRGLTKEDKAIFDRETIRLKLSIDAAKKLQTNNEEIICLFHYPPFNSKKENNVFTTELEKAGITKVVYGHLHGKSNKNNLTFIKNGVKYFLTSCDCVENNIIEIV